MQRPYTRADRWMAGLFDLLILALLLALLFTFLYFAVPLPPTGEERALIYTVRFTPLKELYTADIRTGDSAMDAVSKRPIGEVVAYETAPAMTDSYSRRRNCLRRVAYPGHVTLLLHIRVSATESESGYVLKNGYALMRGNRVHLRLPSFVGSGKVVDVRAAD